MASDKFTLSAAQQMALIVIELEQQHTAQAVAVLRHPGIGQPEAAKVLENALKALDEAKMAWLHSTQRSVVVASVIPDKLTLVEH